MTRTLPIPTVAAPPEDDRIPPLENGDNLDADEFLRRYEAMPEECDAELVEGIVYMASPVSHANHGRPHQHAGYWLAHYASFTQHTDIGDNSTTRLDLDNAPQPDLLLRLEACAGGQSRLVDDYIDGAPELVVEVAASSAAIDLNQKLTAYLRNGVREYVVVRTLDRAIDYFVLADGRYDRIEPDPADRLHKSRAFPGLWLDSDALLTRDLPRLRAAVDTGCQSPEHADFVKRLKQAAGDTA